MGHHQLGAVQKHENESKGGIYVKGLFLLSILLLHFFFLIGRTWIHDSIGGGTSAGLSPFSLPSSSRHSARAAKKFSCLGAGGPNGSGDCSSACSPVGTVGLASAIYATAAPTVAGAVLAAALLPLLTELRLGQQSPPSKPHTKLRFEGL